MNPNISNKSWGEYSASDYTAEQWHRACLIHQHSGTPTSKTECKLPIRTPDGTINRNGVHAASAALAGARGGVNASSKEKHQAARTLIGLYKTLEEDPPPSLLEHSAILKKEVLEHYGVKGMKWGIRRTPAQLGRAARARGQDYKKSRAEAKAATARTRFSSGSKDAPKNLTDEELKSRINRMETEKKYNELNARTVSLGQKNVNEVLVNVGKGTAQTVLKGAAIIAVGKAVQWKFGPKHAEIIQRGGLKKK